MSQNLSSAAVVRGALRVNLDTLAVAIKTEQTYKKKRILNIMLKKTTCQHYLHVHIRRYYPNHKNLTLYTITLK